MRNQVEMIRNGIAVFILGVSMLGVAPLPGEASGPPLMMGTPPIAGIGDRYLGFARVARDDGKTPLTILCKMGYDSVLFFPGRIVRKVFFGGYSWTGSMGRMKAGSFVIVDPPSPLPVSSNLVVVFEDGISIFRLKVVDPDKPFMARTVVRFKKDQRLK